jgi:hypothetical protein
VSFDSSRSVTPPRAAGRSGSGTPHTSRLAHILAKKRDQAQLVANSAAIQGRKGIVFFDTITAYSGSGHISLWDGSAVVDGGDYFARSPRVYFWSLP